MKFNFTFLILIFTVQLNYAQIRATTENGKEVILQNDGTWRYSILTNEKKSQTYVFMGTDRLEAGEKEYVIFEPYGLSTAIQLAKKESQIMIIFWQSQMSSFYGNLWNGDVYIYLENGTTIKLLDRKMKGINAVNNLKNGGNSYERYSAYFLTPKECEQLKNSDISQISYYVTGTSEGRQILQIRQEQDTCKKQLLELE